MNRQSSIVNRQSSSLAAIASSAVALALMFAPPSVSSPVRATVRDAARPGQALAQVALDGVDSVLKDIGPSAQTRAEISVLKSRLNDSEQRRRQLKIEVALLREKLRDAAPGGIAPYQPAASRPLIVPELIESSVLARERSAVGPAGLLIDKGSVDEVLEEIPVLAGNGPVIDQGGDAGVTADRPVYSGRIVVGKIAGVGRWTSTVRLVTDREYRGRAQLVRETADGFVFGAEGVLEGQGEKLCRLSCVGVNAQVRVGDEVYTAGRSSTLPHPMYYGRVVQAELAPGELEWNVRVEPAVDETHLQTVHILRTKLNPLRVTGN